MGFAFSHVPSQSSNVVFRPGSASPHPGSNSFLSSGARGATRSNAQAAPIPKQRARASVTSHSQSLFVSEPSAQLINHFRDRKMASVLEKILATTPTPSADSRARCVDNHQWDLPQPTALRSCAERPLMLLTISAHSTSSGARSGRSLPALGAAPRRA